MRVRLVVLALGAVVAARAPALATDRRPAPTSEEMLQEQLQALYDREHAETEEEAAAAERRFDEAEEHELQRRRESIEYLIER